MITKEDEILRSLGRVEGQMQSMRVDITTLLTQVHTHERLNAETRAIVTNSLSTGRWLASVLVAIAAAAGGLAAWTLERWG